MSRKTVRFKLHVAGEGAVPAADASAAISRAASPRP